MSPSEVGAGSAPDDFILEVRGLRLSYGGLRALDGVDLSLRRGSITGLIGPNGAGKSTFINTVTGLDKPDSGSILFRGTDIAGLRPDRIAQLGMSRTFQIARGFRQLSVIENMLVHGKAQPGERLARMLGPASRERERILRERAWGLAERFRLTQVAGNTAHAISGGQKKLLEIAQSLMSEPELILLDEPTAGVNPTLTGQIIEHLKELRREGHTFMLVEHNMSVISRLCDTVIVMDRGRKLVEGSFAEVVANPQVQEAYLGYREAVAP